MLIAIVVTTVVLHWPGMVRTLLEAGARADLRMQNGMRLLDWVVFAQREHQPAVSGGSARRVHEDNLRLLRAAGR